MRSDNLLNIQEKIEKLNKEANKYNKEEVISSKFYTTYDEEEDCLKIESNSFETSSSIDDNDIVVNKRKEQVAALVIYDFFKKKDNILKSIQVYFPDYKQGNIYKAIKEYL